MHSKTQWLNVRVARGCSIIIVLCKLRIVDNALCTTCSVKKLLNTKLIYLTGYTLYRGQLHVLVINLQKKSVKLYTAESCVYRRRDITALTATTSTADCTWWIAEPGVLTVGSTSAGKVSPAATRWFFEYPCSIRIWKAGPKSSCHLVLFMAYCRTMAAVLELEQLAKASLHAVLVSIPLVSGVMSFNNDCENVFIIIKDEHAHTCLWYFSYHVSIQHHFTVGWWWTHKVVPLIAWI